MKNLKKITLVLFASLAMFACKSDDEGGDDGNAAQGTVQARVDGSNYESDAAGTSSTIIEAGGTTTLIITSNEFSSSRNITLQLIGYSGEGTYPIGGGANIFGVGIYIEADATNPMGGETWQAPFDDSMVGEINISTATDTNVQGTFNFTARNSDDNSTVAVTEGSFNVEI